MTLAIRPTSDVTISILGGASSAPATVDSAGYETLTGFDEIGGADNIGEVGPMMETGNFTPIKGAQQFYRAVETASSFDMAPADLPADDGQIACKAAYDAAKGSAAETVTILVEDPSGYKTYFRTLITKFARSYGGASDLQLRNISFQPDPSSFVEVTPA